MNSAHTHTKENQVILLFSGLVPRRKHALCSAAEIGEPDERVNGMDSVLHGHLLPKWGSLWLISLGLCG